VRATLVADAAVEAVAAADSARWAVRAEAAELLMDPEVPAEWVDPECSAAAT